MNVKKGDTVKILAGKDRGKSGKISKVFPAAAKAMVDGLNLYKKHVRPKQQGKKGEVISVPRPINASNLMVVCGKCASAVRVGRRLEKGVMLRYCKKCQALI
ncbi:MAG: 50S ribosomal protein L24 [Parcubacteria group bacterium]|nr:50S ribosomal protein L24 [Parcubacteria group bacterium]